MKDEDQNVKGPGKFLRILRLVLTVRETSEAYNQFTLPLSDTHDTTICSFFRSDIIPSKKITLFEGDDSLKGFLRTLKVALADRPYDVIHAHAVHVGFLFLVATFLRFVKPVRATVVTVHTSFPNIKLRNKMMFIPVFVFFQRVICCGQASFESVPYLYRCLAGDRLCTIANGVDIDRVDRTIGNKRQRLNNGHFTIVTVGRLIEVKNPLSILRAFQQSADPATSLIFIGKGELEKVLLETMKACNLEKQVQLTGLIPREEVYRNLVNADLFVLASRVEGLPIAVLEAMACGCPVILSDIPSHREIADGVDFIPLIPPDDVAGFAREIRWYRHMSASERADIGEKCRKLVEDRFSLKCMHDAYGEIYAQVLNEY